METGCIGIAIWGLEVHSKIMQMNGGVREP